MKKSKLFDFAIGNPPYQDDNQGDGNKTFAAPVYNVFMDGAYSVANKVELITPARFLFRAGSTPKDWNEKMLNDPHLKVLNYEVNASKMFPNTDIKGGVAVTYRDSTQLFGPIGIFTAYPELNNIMHKAAPKTGEQSLSDIIYTQTRFNLTALYAKHPEYRNILGSNGNDRRFRNNIFDKVALFASTRATSTDIAVYGVIKNKRVWRYIPRDFVDMNHENINKWKVLVPRANGSGALGEVLSTPLIGEPLIGYTQTFIGVGSFNTESEAQATFKYLKTKFARCMLGILKITQDNDREVWRCVPLQDFTSSSDIDWSKSIHDIDQQLYRKYGLSDDEIEFIETHVKEMN